MPVRDAIAETVYPSVASLAIGRVCGRLLNLLPLRIGRIRLTHLLFGALLMPVAPLLYVAVKLVGRCYPLTQSAVEAWPMLGSKRLARVPLADIAAAQVRVRGGQAFYRAGDVLLQDAAGQTLLTLEGVPQPERVQSLIIGLQDAAAQRDHALQTIAAREPVASS